MKSRLLILLLFTGLMACQKEPVIETPRPPQVSGESELKQTVLIEPIVSVNCGICPLAHHDLDRIEDSLDNVVHMSHYLFGPLHHPYSKYLMDRIDRTVFTPLGIIDRRKEDGTIVYHQREVWESSIHTEITDGTQIGMKVSVDAADSEWKIDVALDDQAGVVDNELLLTIVLVEKLVIGEGVGYDQRNYGNDDPDHPFYGQGDYIEGFEHTNVIREVLTAFEGDAITMQDNQDGFNYSFDPSGLSNPPEKYAIIAFVTNAGSELKTVLNAAYQEVE